MRLVYRYMVILCLFFIVPDTLRADGEDVLERMISLPKMKGTVYSLLGNISQQSGYLFIYDSKVVDNDVTVKIRKGERTIRQAIYEITGDTSLEFKVIGTHILITSSSPTKQQQAKPSSVHPVNLMLTGTLLDKETGMPIASASEPFILPANASPKLPTDKSFNSSVEIVSMAPVALRNF